MMLIKKENFNDLVGKLVKQVENSGGNYIGMYPILRGGYYVAVALSRYLLIPLVDKVEPGVLIVDDIIDSGKTLGSKEFEFNDKLVLIAKGSNVELVDYYGMRVDQDTWVEFWWENTQEDAEDLVRRQLQMIGEDVTRPGLVDTPKRVVRMWKETFRGYDKKEKPKITVFNNGSDGIAYDQMIVDTGDFISRCEHHAEIFFGDYVFAYIPHLKGRVVGLSKVARVVDYYSARLQVQERLVDDIVKELWDALCEGTEWKPLGMGLVMEGMHMCKVARGAKKKGKMITSKLVGNFRDREIREEFMNFVNRSLQNSAW